MQKNNQGRSDLKSGFTLIELLVVIAIIGLIATLSVIALNNARAKSRDAKRAADIKQMQTALELYFNDKGRYPTTEEFAAATSIFSTSTGVTTTYMQIIPTPPTPADGSCSTATNQYVYTSTGNETYTLSYCLGGQTGQLAAADKCATPGGVLNASCGSGGGGGTPPPPAESACFSDPSGCSWEDIVSNMTTGQAQEPNINVYNDIPYIAYLDSTDYYPRVKKWQNNNWVEIGGGSPYETSSGGLSLFVQDENNIYLSLIDWGDSGKVKVFYFNGISWSALGGAISYGAGENTSLYVYQGTPYLAYTDWGESKRIIVKKFDGSDWVGASSQGMFVSGGAATSISLTFLGGIPHVTYLIENDMECSAKYRFAVVKKLPDPDSSWTYVDDVCNIAGNSGFNNYTVDSFVYNDELYVALLDLSNAGKLRVKKLSGSSWVDAINSSASVSTPSYVSMAIYNGRIYLQFRDGVDDKNHVVRSDQSGSSWEAVGTNPVSASSILYRTDISFSSDGTPYIIFPDNGYSNGELRVRRFISN